jgi:hypothetical protein
MSEAQCYERCYGGARHIQAIRRTTAADEQSGERLRRAFARRLRTRAREAA